MSATPSQQDSATEDWASIVAAKQEQVRALVPSEWRLPQSITSALEQPLDQNPTNLIALDIPRRSGILSDQELDITESYNVRELLDALATGRFSSEEVVTAYCKRAAIAQELTRCLTETYYAQAIERAKSLDEYRAREGKVVGPLHGLPISIKDMINVKDSDSSIGFVSMLNSPKKQNAVLVDILLDLGAVIYVKTNIPQTLMVAESENNIFGRVLNPHNTALTPGGSSGGEGALIAFRGSPLGVGTDIGGSIRIPALCCGIYGFKPSASRIPVFGWTVPALKGFGLILPSAGPLAHSVDALEIFTKTVLDARPASADVMALDIAWRTLSPLPVDTRLTIGLLPEDPMYPLHPSMKRALVDATRLLEAKGHAVVPLPVSNCHIADASEVCWAMFGLETATMQAHIQRSGEPMIPIIAGVKPANLGSYRFVPDLSGVDMVNTISTLNIMRFIIEDDWRKMWHGQHLDVVIGPGAQGTAVKHGKFGFVPYTCFLNLLNYPACIVPFNQASKTKDANAVRVGEGQGGPDYEVDGMPCHIQVITRNLRDEECLNFTRLIDQCLNGAQ